jgi:hypothetical protein
MARAPLLPLSASLGIVLAVATRRRAGCSLRAAFSQWAPARRSWARQDMWGRRDSVLLALAVVLRPCAGPQTAARRPHRARGPRFRVGMPVVKVEGRLAEEPVRCASGRTRLILDVDGFFDEADRRPASGRLQVTLYGETASVGEGQRVAVDLKLARPRGFRNPDAFDYPAFLRREGILLVGSGRAEPSCRSRRAANPCASSWAVAASASPAKTSPRSGRPDPRRRPDCRPRPTGPSAARRVPHPRRLGFQRGPPGSSVFFVLSALGCRAAPPRWRRAWRWWASPSSWAVRPPCSCHGHGPPCC